MSFLNMAILAGLAAVDREVRDSALLDDIRLLGAGRLDRGYLGDHVHRIDLANLQANDLRRCRAHLQRNFLQAPLLKSGRLPCEFVAAWRYQIEPVEAVGIGFRFAFLRSEHPIRAARRKKVAQTLHAGGGHPYNIVTDLFFDNLAAVEVAITSNWRKGSVSDSCVQFLAISA